MKEEKAVLCVPVSQDATGGHGQTVPIIARACKMLKNVEMKLGLFGSLPRARADVRFCHVLSASSRVQSVTFRYQYSGTLDRFPTASKCWFLLVVSPAPRRFSSRLLLACSTCSRPVRGCVPRCSLVVRCSLIGAARLGSVKAYGSKNAVFERIGESVRTLSMLAKNSGTFSAAL